MLIMNKLRFCNLSQSLYSGKTKMAPGRRPHREGCMAMFFVSEVKRTIPDTFKTALQEKVYQALAELSIPFERVDTDVAVTMNDCLLINRRLSMQMVKTLFLCNRRKTEFLLFIGPGDKPFRSGEFGGALGVERLSFAPAELLESMLGTGIGAATVFSALLDSSRGVRFVFDAAVAAAEWYGCSDGTTTGYMKIRTEHVLKRFLPATGRTHSVVRL